MSDAMREMTLEEYIGQLPDCHRAYKEYESLKAEIERKDKALNNVLVTMRHARIFVNSRERIKRPEGIDLYDDCIQQAEQALKSEAEDE